MDIDFEKPILDLPNFMKATLKDVPIWIHVSELFLPLAPFRCDPRYAEILAQVGDAMESLKDRTTAEDKSVMKRKEIQATVSSLMIAVAAIEPKTDDQVVWLIQLLCRFILQQYKPPCHIFLFRLMSKVREWQPQIWDDDDQLHHIAGRIHTSLGNKVSNYKYVCNYLASTNPMLIYIFTSICCVIMQEVIFNMELEYYAPVTPQQMLSLAQTFRFNKRNIDYSRLYEFLKLFATYLRLISMKNLDRTIPRDKMSKYFTISTEVKASMQKWTENALKLVDIEIGSNCTQDLMTVRELLEFDVLATLKGNSSQFNCSFVWQSPRH